MGGRGADDDASGDSGSGEERGAGGAGGSEEDDGGGGGGGDGDGDGSDDGAPWGSALQGELRVPAVADRAGIAAATAAVVRMRRSVFTPASPGAGLLQGSGAAAAESGGDDGDWLAAAAARAAGVATGGGSDDDGAGEERAAEEVRGATGISGFVDIWRTTEARRSLAGATAAGKAAAPRGAVFRCPGSSALPSSSSLEVALIIGVAIGFAPSRPHSALNRSIRRGSHSYSMRPPSHLITRLNTRPYFASPGPGPMRGATVNS
jgi:hypothetical protein